jgi:hypothetical protein
MIFFSFLAIFSIFEAEARTSALKILKKRRTKVVNTECSQFFRLQLSSIFEFEIFPKTQVKNALFGLSFGKNQKTVKF